MPRRSLAPVAALLYAVALSTPALVITNHPIAGQPENRAFFGFECLGYGWAVEPAWLANPALLVAVLALIFKRPTLAIWATIAAIALGASTLLVFGGDLRYPHVGFFAWMASMIVVLIESRRRDRPTGAAR